MNPVLDTYDWREVFAVAGDPAGGWNDPSVNWVPPLSAGDISHFGRGDVARIVWMDEGDNDGPDWLIGGTLKDGRWFFIAAGCDYTGWDCQTWGRAYVSSTREGIERFGMGEGDRARLGVVLPEDTERRTEAAGR